MKVDERIYQKAISVQGAQARYNLSTSAPYKYVRFYRNDILPNKIKTSVEGLTSEEEEIVMHHLPVRANQEIGYFTKKYSRKRESMSVLPRKKY